MCYSSQLVIPPGRAEEPPNQRLIEQLRQIADQWDGTLFETYYANAFARPNWPVIAAEAPDQAQAMRWGLVPTWAKDPSSFLRKAATYNAISRTVFEKPSFRSAMKHGRRCLVPVTGFYEWHHRNKLTYPHFIRLRARQLFCLAGIYENDTYSILTTEANPLMGHIHNKKKRMPVILSHEDEHAWLSSGLSKEDVLDLCAPYPEDDMQAWTVSRNITKRGSDPNTPSAHLPVHYPELDGGLPLE